MAALPEPNHSTVAKIVEWYAAQAATKTPREYLGASSLGHECQRYPALAFRLARTKPKDGRVARLLQTGHREELRLLADLRAIGVKVWDRDEAGQQWSVSFLGGHGRGHLDAVALGLPEAPKTPHVIDCKTTKAEKFRAVVKHGIRKTFPVYFAQGVLYMGLMDLERAAFLFVNKDDDSLHLERFEFDRTEFDRLMALAERIVFGAALPPKAGEKAEDIPCEWCDFKDVCWGEQTVPATCRSCAHVTPERDGTWQCGRHTRALSFAEQRAGCRDHRFVPIYLEHVAEPVDSDGDAVTYRHRASGRTFVNGSRPGYLSAEIHACADRSMLGDAFVEELRETCDGTVVG